MYRLVWTAHFSRAARKFVQNRPELKKRLADVLRSLEDDPTQQHLSLHPLKGKLQGMHAASLTHSYRITLTLKVTEREILLLDIGSHGDVYR